MSTVSEVKAGLDAISQTISNKRRDAENAKAALAQISTELDALATEYSEVIAQIGLYTPTGALETLAVDELAKMTAEFVALKAEVDAAVAAITLV